MSLLLDVGHPTHPSLVPCWLALITCMYCAQTSTHPLPNNSLGTVDCAVQSCDMELMWDNQSEESNYLAVTRAVEYHFTDWLYKQCRISTTVTACRTMVTLRIFCTMSVWLYVYAPQWLGSVYCTCHQTIL